VVTWLLRSWTGRGSKLLNLHNVANFATYNVCLTTDAFSVKIRPRPYTTYNVTSPPDSLTGLTVGLDPYDTSRIMWFSFDPALAGVGTHTYNFIKNITGPDAVSSEAITLVFEVLDCTLDPLEEALNGLVTPTDICCVDACNIAWYDREGGWLNYIFSGVKTYKVRIGKDGSFIEVGDEGALTQKNNEIKGVYDAKICSTRDAPQTHIDELDSLRYSIQAFLYNTATSTWDIPILLDKKNFTKYKSRDKFFEVKIQYILAEEILIQTQ